MCLLLYFYWLKVQLQNNEVKIFLKKHLNSWNPMIQYTWCPVHKYTSYFFYYGKSQNSKRYPFTNVKFEIWNRIKIKFFDHIVICLLSFEHFSRGPFSSGHIRTLDLLTPNKNLIYRNKLVEVQLYCTYDVHTLKLPDPKNSAIFLIQ